MAGFDVRDARLWKKSLDCGYCLITDIAALCAADNQRGAIVLDDTAVLGVCRWLFKGKTGHVVERVGQDAEWNAKFKRGIVHRAGEIG